MAKFPKKEKKQKEDRNVLQDPEMRKKFKQMLVVITEYFAKVDALKEGMKETVAEVSAEYGLDKKTVRKMASTMYHHNYGSLQEENRHFEILYETIVEGRLRDPDGAESPDPLDAEDEQE